MKEQRQKRLLLVNVKELHIEYLKETGDKIGFSTFAAELRPKWCVPVSSTGMHSVCVCEIHQNVKLLVCAIPGQCTYKELMGKVVCNIDNRNCMLPLYVIIALEKKPHQSIYWNCSRTMMLIMTTRSATNNGFTLTELHLFQYSNFCQSLLRQHVMQSMASVHITSSTNLSQHT